MQENSTNDHEQDSESGNELVVEAIVGRGKYFENQKSSWSIIKYCR